MKLQLLMVLFLLQFAGINGYGQCLPAIPANAVVINSNDTINGGFTPAWVCSGDTFVSNGGIFNVYLEPGAVMFTGGGIDTIFVRKGAKFNMNGGIHFIYYEDINDLTLAGGIPTNVLCNNMVFDYTNAPANGCATGPIAAFTVKDSILCAGDCIDYTNKSFSATWFYWQFPGGNPSTDTSANPTNICYYTSGTYNVTLIAGNSMGSDTLEMTNLITVYPLPVVNITQTLNQLTATPGFASYQWYFGNILIQGATSNTFNAFQNGSYFLHVYSTNGCDTVVSFVFNSQPVMELDDNKQLQLLLDDAHHSIDINCNSNDCSKLIRLVEVFNSTGVCVLQLKAGESSTYKIYTQSFSPGIYFVRIATEKKFFVREFFVRD